jgi:VanZ family protein
VSATLLYWLPAAATAMLIFGLSQQPSLPELPGHIPDWVAHGLEYGFFTLTLVYATTRGFDDARRTPARVAMAVLIASLYGISDEFHQSFVGRDPSAKDWLADTVGALLMAALILALWRRMAGPRTQV